MHQQVPQERWKVKPGDQFGMLEVVGEPYYRRFERAGRVQYVTCKCVCGTVKDVQCGHLIGELTKSCGCNSGQFRAANSKRRGTLASNGLKTCAGCLLVSPVDNFDCNKSRTDGLNSYCKGCRKDHLLQRDYGISLAEYNAMLTAQGGRCAICRKTEAESHTKRGQSLVVDHCHATGRVRGILCSMCNSALGLLGDSVEGIEAAYLYLKGCGE